MAKVCGAGAERPVAPAAAAPGSCGVGCACGRTQDLTELVDKSRVTALNEKLKGSHENVLLAYPEAVLETQEDDPVCILYLPLLSACNISHITIKGRGDATAPTKVSLFKDRPTLGFEDVDSYMPTAELELSAEATSGGQAVKLNKQDFRKTNSLHLYFENDNDDAASSVIQQVILWGHAQAKLSDLSGLKKFG